MSYPVDWFGANKTLVAPKGTTEEQVCDMRIFTNGSICVSRWKLSEEAIKEVIETGCLFVTLMSGYTQPPVFVGSHDEAREIAVDYGHVWKLK